MNEFKVNELITLKLEDGKTIIYVDGEEFRQCKYLLLDIPVEQASSFEEIDSIDEAEENLDGTMEEGNPDNVISIPPETEFWGHCSNLQAWYENDYDTRLIHRNLAFPLLKKLTEVGDLIAKRVFKEEIAKRFLSGNQVVQDFLIEQNYLDFLDREEFWSLFEFDTCPLQEIEMLSEKRLKLLNDTKPYGINADTSVFRIEKDEVIEIIITNSALKMLPESIGDMKSLKKLIVYQNHLKSLPESIGELSSLEELHLQRNHIEKLPDSIGKLSSLKTLELSNNKLKELPNTIGNLKNLEILGVEVNQLTYLPEEIGNLEKLKDIQLYKNNLNQLPESIIKLKSLERLNLEKNELVDIEDSLLNLDSLKVLILRKNPCFNRIIQKVKKEKIKVSIS